MMLLQIEKLTRTALRATLGTVLGFSLIPLAANPIFAQISTVELENDDLAELLDELDCAVRVDGGGIILVDGANADIDDDGRPERFCTPGRVDLLTKNEDFTELDLLTRTDYDDDDDFDEEELLITDVIDIISVRERGPDDYVVAISGTSVVTDANLIDLVEVSQEDAEALLEEIELSRTVAQERTIIETESEPLPVQPPEPAPRPAPAPRVQPAPSVPALW